MQNNDAEVLVEDKQVCMMKFQAAGFTVGELCLNVAAALLSMRHDAELVADDKTCT